MSSTSDTGSTGEIIGPSALREALTRAALVARTAVTVLISGESETGNTRARSAIASRSHGGLAQKFDHMYVVHRGNVSRFNDVALNRSEALDFRVYSKALNPGPGPYDFRRARLVDPGNA